MGIKMGFASLIIFVMSVINLGEVKGFKNFEVGGAMTWRIPDNNDTAFYGEWASSKRFHVGDTLHFIYKNDSVELVDKHGFYHCDTTSGTALFNDGNTMFKLQHPGFTYFISGNVDHCLNGQRLAVDVMAPHNPPGANAPEHFRAESPGPSQAHNSGSQLGPMAQVLTFLGLVILTSVFVV